MKTYYKNINNKKMTWKEYYCSKFAYKLRLNRFSNDFKDIY